jgi:hypothetical protein
MRYQVPQFIEVEDKIFGPLTIKQFIYLAGGGGLSMVFYLVIPTIFISVLFIIPVVAFACSLAFVRINNRPFVNVLESAFVYFITPKLYVWKHEPKKVEQTKKEEPAQTGGFIPTLSNSKLKELTWKLDTKEAINPITRDTDKENQKKDEKYIRTV